MVSAAVIFLVLLFLSAAVGAAACVLLHRLASQRQVVTRAWLLPWALKGLLLPWALWCLMNLGLSWSLQPFMPEVQLAQNAGSGWMVEFVTVAAEGLFVLSSYWAALTLGWGLYLIVRALDETKRQTLLGLARTCAIGMAVPALIIFLVAGWPGLGVAAAAILGPIAGYAPSVLQGPKTPPIYARAIARIKFGKYTEAEWEIIQQLEKSQDDFEGWMMLAELYATHFHDVAEAEQTVLEVCDHPQTTPSQLAVALHRLADWHLKHSQDPQAARRALLVICERLKGTHLAHMAQLRVNQLPRTAEELRRQQENRPIPLPHYPPRA
jgi:hypothetical protein